MKTTSMGSLWRSPRYSEALDAWSCSLHGEGGEKLDKFCGFYLEVSLKSWEIMGNRYRATFTRVNKTPEMALFLFWLFTEPIVPGWSLKFGNMGDKMCADKEDPAVPVAELNVAPSHSHNTHTHTHTNTWINQEMNKYIHVYIDINININKYIYIHIHTYIHMYIINGGSNGKIIYHGWSFHCHVWLPVGQNEDPAVYSSPQRSTPHRNHRLGFQILFWF